MGFVLKHNAFAELDDPAKAQRQADRFAQLDWNQILKRYAHRVNPLLRQELADCRLRWFIDQAEFASDLLFQSSTALAGLYQKLLRFAVVTFTPKDILGFLGRKSPLRRRGVYTSGALEQLKSGGFKYEKTSDAEFAKKVTKWKKVTEGKRTLIWKKLLELNARGVQEFMTHLERAVQRQIAAVRVVPLHGLTRDYLSVHEAINFIERYDEAAEPGPLVKYEVLIRYDNGDKVEGEFHDKAAAIVFLDAYQTGNWTPAIDDKDADVE